MRVCPHSRRKAGGPLPGDILPGPRKNTGPAGEERENHVLGGVEAELREARALSQLDLGSIPSLSRSSQ